MSYKIKDKEFERKLIGLFGDEETFNRALQKVCENQWNDGTDIILMENKGSTYYVKGLPVYSLTIFKDDIEVVPEYNADGWNEYPEVQPKSGTEYLVEHYDGQHAIANDYRYNTWVASNFAGTLQNVVRFRELNKLI